MADKNWLTVVKDKETEESSRDARQDADRDLRNLEPYIMKTLDGTAKAKDVANVTSPEPALFMSKTIAKLVGVERQPEVLANKKTMSDADTTVIEEFIEDQEYEIDALQNQRGEVPAFNFHSDIACSRGRIAEQIVTRMKDGVYIPDVRPLDTRYFRYEMGSEGMIWGAPITWKTRERLKEEYPEIQLGAKVGKANRHKVTDVWTGEENIVYVEGSEIRRRKQREVLGYDLKKPPFILQIVPAGSVLKDQDNLKHSGESVYEHLRTVFPEFNFIVSTLKTLNYGLFAPPLSLARKDGEGDAPDEYVGAPGKMTVVETPGAIQPVFTPDIRRFTLEFIRLTKEVMDKAGYSSIDFGLLPWPLSAVAMARLAQGKLELLAPRLQALAYLYQARYNMIIEQYLMINEALELGELHHRRKYEPSKLKGEYTIKFRFFTTSKEEMASDAAIASAMGDDVSEDYKRREIYKLPDPDGEKRKLRAEQAERGDPAILLYNQCHSLVEEDRLIEAELLLQRLETLLRQRRMPQVSPETEPGVPERRTAQPLMELFAGGGGGRPPPEEEV